MSVVRRLADVALTVAAVAGVLGLVLFVLVQAGVVQTLVVTSGSMRPTYDVGDVVISRSVDAGRLATGDVATLEDATGRLITHRVVSAEPASAGAASVVMQGDANDAPDAVPYVVDEALVPVVRVPGVGPLVAAVQRPSVAIPGLVAVAALVAIAFVPSGRRDEPQDGAASEDDGAPAPARRGRHAARA
ncbi:signal peptidase I [Cellulosimicrobium sp. Marseille-Q4280]|uniref:signal peptidase I n=1 Tax=Cellulosimicrobium sp. Marseille-Q4280 TaxID=2937992 RepID=UPI0020404ED1|nr:signal peptidase I [Cellulosimicrobium sp. Marseille-Q4280]